MAGLHGAFKSPQKAPPGLSELRASVETAPALPASGLWSTHSVGALGTAVSPLGGSRRMKGCLPPVGTRLSGKVKPELHPPMGSRTGWSGSPQQVGALQPQRQRQVGEP